MKIKADNSSSEQVGVNIKVIAFLVAAIVVLFTIIYCVKTYADKKSTVINDMRIEAKRLEMLFIDELNTIDFIMHTLKEQISKHPEDKEFIDETLRNYHSHTKVEGNFIWTMLGWVDKDLNMVVNSIKGQVNPPAYRGLYSHIVMSEYRPDHIFYGPRIIGTFSHKHVLPIALGAHNKEGEYLGTILMGIDLKRLRQRMNDRKKSEHTHFAIIDRGLHAIVEFQSPSSKVGIKNGLITSHNLTNVIKRMGFYSDSPVEKKYLDMYNGLNYYAHKVTGYPFILLVNIDHEEIRNNILSTVLGKLAEIALVASIFLVLIIAVYKRETWLRSQAEKASSVAKKATASKTDFLAFTAHEIRSPLGFILTGSEIMDKRLFGEIPKAYNEYVNGIHNNAKLILEFINDILDESHIAEGNFKIDNSVVDITPIIHGAIDTNQKRFNSRKVSIQYKEDALPSIVCDERRVGQIINNLLSNSIKYSKDGTEITIKAYCMKDKLYISIADQGVGMTIDEIKLALERFGQIRRKNFSITQGFGLGLPIVKKLVEAHDAELTLESKVGVGTTATIAFPKHKLIYKKGSKGNA